VTNHARRRRLCRSSEARTHAINALQLGPVCCNGLRYIAPRNIAALQHCNGLISVGPSKAPADEDASNAVKGASNVC
jgi:hypothetical protein